MPIHNLGMEDRAERDLNLKFYDNLYPMPCEAHIEPIKFIPTEAQHILRMMIRAPWSHGFRIPKELQWLKPQIDAAYADHCLKFPSRPFIYITVRSGEVISITDDEWHVDGFSMRIPHQPEQNYIWTSSHPTEWLNQIFKFPHDFDPMKHNIHQYFQDNADETKIKTVRKQSWYIIDPYVVHRRPKVPPGTVRTMVRISFVPIEIQDNTCSRNPLMRPITYSHRDIRETLCRYKG